MQVKTLLLIGILLLGVLFANDDIPNYGVSDSTCKPSTPPKDECNTVTKIITTTTTKLTTLSTTLLAMLLFFIGLLVALALVVLALTRKDEYVWSGWFGWVKKK